MPHLHMARSLAGIEPLLQLGPYNEVPEGVAVDTSAAPLREAKVLVVGAGGLGCEVLKNLALTGFADIHVIDMDTIDVSNLNRQFLFRDSDVGKSKAETAAAFVTARVGDPQLRITPHFCRIDEKSRDFYTQFSIVVCGLDNVEARRWINALLVELTEDDVLIPMVDGGTEGFRGQARVILPRISSCFECLLDMLAPRTTYPVCTIANTPRLPEHCIEWASELEWRRLYNFPFDADNEEDVDRMYALALGRAREFGIEGVTRALTLGVVKNIIPAIAATNAVIAAACCNEVFKIVLGTYPFLDNYMMYSGDDSIFTYTFAHLRKELCAVCGGSTRPFAVQRWWRLRHLVEELGARQDVQLREPSLATARGPLYMRRPEALEEQTRPNLDLLLLQLVQPNEEIVVTDPHLKLSLRLVLQPEGPLEAPTDANSLLRM